MEIEFREFPADSEAETPYIDIKTFELNFQLNS